MSKPTLYEYKGWFAPVNDLLNPIWTLRLCPLLSLACLFLGEMAFPTGFFHGLFLGLTTGMLVATISVAFQMTGVILRRPVERSDVDDLPVTP